ncbi:MAG: MATE family efflux transporter, partial [Halobacteriales archaeon]|nr:MATE family efflux transporter [Halobacteriales archaeon]
LAPAIVRAFDPGAAVTPYATAYLATYALGLPMIFLADTAEASLVGVGDSRGSFMLNGLAVGLNVLLDPLLIFGFGPIPALGVRGAALATIIGYSIGFGLAVVLFIRGRQGLILTREAVRVDTDRIREIVDVGLPNTGQRVGQQGARVVLIGIVSAVSGPAGLSAYTVGARVASIAFIPAQGLGQAAQSIVAQNLGAARHGRAQRATWIGAAIAIGGLGVVGVLQWFVPGPLTALFIPDASQQGAALTESYLRILAYGYPALGAVYMFAAGFNGARRTRITMMATLLQYWAVRVPIAVVGAITLGYGVIAVFWAVTISNIVGATGSGIYYRHASANGMLVRAARRAGEAANVDPPGSSRPDGQGSGSDID